MARMTGVIYSDLGLGSSFMALDWVQFALAERLGFTPFPATLNVRPRGTADVETWWRIRNETRGVRLASVAGFCNARLYPIAIDVERNSTWEKIINGAIVLPEVEDYPSDKIEIVAPVRLKDHLGVGDGDHLTWEFLN